MQGLKVIHVFETVLNLFNECDKLKSELEEKKSVFSWGQRSHIFFTRSGGGASFVSCIYDSIVRTSCGLCNWMWLTMCSWFVFGQWKTVRMYLMPLRWFCSIFFFARFTFSCCSSHFFSKTISALCVRFY